MTLWRWRQLVAFGLLALSLIATPVHAVELVFGIISTEASAALKQQWAPVMADLEAATGLKIKPFFASDYAGIIEGMRFNKVQLAYFGNKSAMEAVDRADGQIFAQAIQASGLPGYYSYLITNRDGPIKSLDDVLANPGKFNFANGDPNSTSGFLVPGYYVFALNHIDPKTHFKRVVNGSHETNLMAVLNRQVDLATNNSNDMEKLRRELGARIDVIQIIWTSPLIPADPLVWRRDLDEALKAKISAFFYGYGRSGSDADQQRARDNLRLLTFAGFRPSTDAQLVPIRELELFKERTKVEADGSLPNAEKTAKLAEIDARLAQLRLGAAPVQP